VSFRDGPEQGLRIVDALTGEPRFREFALVHAARGDMLRRLGRSAPCAEAYEAARLRAGTPAERRFLEKRIAGAMSA
jgi:RNA polymerase sigma-70 factor (ECF subfamily)